MQSITSLNLNLNLNIQICWDDLIYIFNGWGPHFTDEFPRNSNWMKITFRSHPNSSDVMSITFLHATAAVLVYVTNVITMNRPSSKRIFAYFFIDNDKSLLKQTSHHHFQTTVSDTCTPLGKSSRTLFLHMSNLQIKCMDRCKRLAYCNIISFQQIVKLLNVNVHPLRSSGH